MEYNQCTHQGNPNPTRFYSKYDSRRPRKNEETGMPGEDPDTITICATEPDQYNYDSVCLV